MLSQSHHQLPSSTYVLKVPFHDLYLYSTFKELLSHSEKQGLADGCPQPSPLNWERRTLGSALSKGEVLMYRPQVGTQVTWRGYHLPFRSLSAGLRWLAQVLGQGAAIFWQVPHRSLCRAIWAASKYSALGKCLQRATGSQQMVGSVSLIATVESHS